MGEFIVTATSSWMLNKSVDGDGSFVVNIDVIGVLIVSDGVLLFLSD